MAYTMEEFKEKVSQLKQVTPEEVNEFKNSEDKHLVFIGRPTCGFCRAFLPKLLSVASVLNEELYFLDSAETATDDTLSALRDEVGAATVPSLVYFGGDSAYNNLHADSAMSEEEITKIIEE